MSQIIDFHSHVLPGVDDGSESVEQSIAMLQMAAKQGIRRVIATPHFYAQHDKPEELLQKRQEAADRLRAEMANHTDLPELGIGAEVYYFNGISDSDILTKLTVENTPYVMIEMPMPPWNDRVYRELENIWIKQGLMPVIAHIDRYIAPFHTHGIPKKLSRLPVMVQANASFFIDKSTRSMALRMLRRGTIQLLGSDCHNLTDRAPNLGQALEIIEKKFGPGMLEHLQFCQDELYRA